MFNTHFIGLCVASRQADLQPGEVLLQLEEDQDQDLSHGPAGQEAGQQERERRQVGSETSGGTDKRRMNTGGRKH